MTTTLADPAVHTQPPQDIEFQQSGSGAPIVFVPGSFSAGSSWRNIVAPLSQRYRTITTSLCGYGKTAERRVPGGSHMDDQMDVLQAVLAQAGEPVHLVAHSFGAWSALLLALCRQPRLLSLTLLEPTAFSLLPMGEEHALSQKVQALSASYTADWAGGDPLAVRQIIDFYGGAGCFDAYPAAVQAKLASQTATNLLDWHSAHPTPSRLADLAAVRVPTLVVCGSASEPAMQRSTQLLAAHLPQARWAALEGANHFMIVTHAPALTQVIEQHVLAPATA